MLRTSVTCSSGNGTLFRLRTFGYNNIYKTSSLLITELYTFQNFLYIIRYLRYETNFSTTGNGCVQRNPASISSHYFHDHGTMMTFCGCHQLVKAIRSNLYCCLKTKGHVSGAQIVVDSLRYTDNRYALFK